MRNQGAIAAADGVDDALQTALKRLVHYPMWL